MFYMQRFGPCGGFRKGPERPYADDVRWDIIADIKATFVASGATLEDYADYGTALAQMGFGDYVANFGLIQYNVAEVN